MRFFAPELNNGYNKQSTIRVVELEEWNLDIKINPPPWRIHKDIRPNPQVTL